MQEPIVERGDNTMSSPSQEAGHDKTHDHAEEGAPSKGDLIRMKLKIVAGYVVMGFAPIASAIALTLAIVALVVTQSAQTQSDEASGKLGQLNASLATYRTELDKLRAELAQEKALREEQQKKQDELIARIVPALSQLQGKLKIAPTLEEQLQQPASSPVAATAPAAAAATTPAAPATPAPAAADKKTSTQVQNLKEALDKFNKK
jgi:hypothetical protein